MSDSTTATVETLTAEVRALMVGSRQVTMSVYNQLDRVPHSQIDRSAESIQEMPIVQTSG